MGDGDAQPRFRPAQMLQAHTLATSVCKFSPANGELLATASADKTAKIWNVATGALLQTLEGHVQGISDVAWAAAGNYLCTASDDHTLKLWDVGTGRCLRTLRGHTNFVFCCCFSPQGHLVASGSFDETLRVWDVRSGHCLREVPAHSDPITAVGFNHDGTLLVTSSLDGLCRIWDTQTGHCLKTLFDKQSPPASCVRFSPNGRFILSSSLDSKIRLWDFERGSTAKSYQGHVNTQFCTLSTFSGPHGAPRHRSSRRSSSSNGGSRRAPAGSVPTAWVVTGSEDGCVYVYALNDGKELQVIRPEQQQQQAEEEPPAAENGEAGQAPQEEGRLNAVLCVDAHPTRPLLAACGHGKPGSVHLYEHVSG